MASEDLPTKNRSPSLWITFATAILTAVVTACATVTGSYFAFANKDRELNIKLIEVGLSILRADPKEDIAPARSWAIEIIEKSSGTPFSADDKAQLLHKPLNLKELKIYGSDFNPDFLHTLDVLKNGKF